MIVGAVVPAVAEDDQKLRINGFGGWSYGDTDGNRYLSGTEDGEVENVIFGLLLTVNPTERLRILAQIELESVPLDAEEGVEVDLDAAIVEWQVSSFLRLRAGRKKVFGIYTEIFDIGTLRPFIDLPQGIYGAAGIAGEVQDGVGITGDTSFGAGWSLEYDVYVGGLSFDSLEAWDGLRDDDDDDPGDDSNESLIENKKRNDLVGTRLAFHTPVEGLSFGMSAYTGVARDDDEGQGDARHTTVGVHVEYLAGPWLVRAEAAHLDEEAELSADTMYVEVARMFDDHWQLAARYDYSDTEVEEIDISALPSLGEHRDAALGVNYWFSPQLVAKASIHAIEGNRFALPESIDEAIDLGMLDDETTLVTVGVQFSF